MNDVSAGAYITDTKIPVLRVGDTVILDSLSACRVAEVRKAIGAFGARVLYLPPPVPTSNPIEGSRTD
jgi:transposase